MNMISHRGNLDGPNALIENSPDQIERCLELGFECEIDLRTKNQKLFLGHDTYQYEISIDWLSKHAGSLWIHCKDSESLSFLKGLKGDFNYFWHETDKHTITSKGVFWNYPGGPITGDSIAVLPETWWNPLSHRPLKEAMGICTDFPNKFRQEMKLV